MLKILSLITVILSMTVYAQSERSPAAKGAELYIISPQDGATVKSPVSVVFGLRNMGVAPAGVQQAATGHHHLLIDVVELPPGDQPIPADDRHRHFGGGQTEALLALPPGMHTLQLLLGDHQHIPHQPPVTSRKITIKVE